MATIRSSPRNMPDACKVVIKDGTQMLQMPDGSHIPCQIWSRVYTGIDQPNYAIVKLYVNLEGDTAFNKPEEQPNANSLTFPPYDYEL